MVWGLGEKDPIIKIILSSAVAYLETIIALLSQQIKMIEKQAMDKISLTESFKWLSTINGVGKILAMVIMMEVGDIDRFKKVGNYCSYCLGNRRTRYQLSADFASVL